MENYLPYPLTSGGFVNRFLRWGTFTRRESFTRCTLQGRVNEWMKHGFAIHENPCRKEFVANRAKNPPAYRDLFALREGDELVEFGQKLAGEVYFPFGNIRVDASAFYFNPTYLRSYCITTLVAPQAMEATFELETCGAATVWADGVLVCDFAPFTRNMRKTTKITIPLQKGATGLTVCLDDLAERDTDYYFGLRYLGETALEMAVPVRQGVDPARVEAMEAFLGDLYLEKEVYIDEPLVLQSGSAALIGATLDITSAPAISVLVDVRGNALGKFSVPVAAGQSRWVLEGSDKLQPEYYYLQICMQAEGITARCKLGTQIFSSELLNTREPDIAKRKAQLLRCLGDTGVNGVYRAAALFYLDEEEKLREEIIAEDLKGIRQRRDCSDFYFVVILYLYKRYAEKMSPALQEDIRETALGFRYWMDEPGDDVMWFFSENHALLFHLCQYFAGCLFPHDTFTNSGLTGTQQRDKALRLLDVWFKDFFVEFITEWNSSAYIPVDVVGFATLYNFEAEGTLLKSNAKRALDMVFRCIAINAHEGVCAVTFGRSYEEHLRGRYVAGTTSLLYLGYGLGYINRCGMAYVSLAMGDYEPPVDYEHYAQPHPGKALVFQNTQGFEGHVNTYLYKTEGGVLSTAVDFNPFTPGYQECVVQAALSPTAQCFINHPGEVQPYGKGRPNYWAGNGELPRAAQYLGTSVLHYDISKENLIDYTHAYLPLGAFDETASGTNYIAARKGCGYIGLAAMNGLAPKEEGPYRGREVVSPGRSNVWVLEVADECEYASLADFAAHLAGLVLTCGGGKARVQGGRYGNISLGKDGLLVNGAGVHAYPLPAEGLLVFKDYPNQKD